MSAHTLAALMVVAALGLAAPTPALAQDHDSHAGEIALNHGSKWNTDAPLRQGMMAMHAAALATSPVELADLVETQTAYIIANCRLPPDADANLHLVIERLIDGADQLRIGDGEPGRAEVVTALNAYGAHFDHPGWQPIER